MPGGNRSLYDKLGVDPKADSGEIRKAYMKLARTHHPDKGGDAEEFKSIQKAYEILSDDGRRAMYDATGAEEEGGGGGPPPGFGGGGMPFPFPFDLGAMFGAMGGGGPFGMRGGRQQQRRGAKAPPKVSEIPVSLHDFYHGKVLRVQFERHRFCDGCKGSGVERWESCGSCGGAGMKQRMVMMGPGMQGMMTGPCEVCGGEGKKVAKGCGVCEGKKVQGEQKVLEVRIEPGARPGDTIVFPRECSDTPDYEEAGDLHIRLMGADEGGEVWRVEGTAHLRGRVQITLQEMLLGCEKMLQGHPGHPQGYSMKIPVGVQSGEIISFGGEGMPEKGSEARGDLQIVVTVVPTVEEKEALKREGAVARVRELFGGGGGAA